MAVLCVPSASTTNSQNAVPKQVETSLCILNTIRPSATSSGEIASYRLFKKTGLVPKVPRKFSIEKKNVVVVEKDKYRGKTKEPEEMKSKSREKERVDSPNISGLQGQKMQRKKSVRTYVHNQKTAENLENNAVSAG